MILSADRSAEKTRGRKKKEKKGRQQGGILSIRRKKYKKQPKAGKEILFSEKGDTQDIFREKNNRDRAKVFHSGTAERKTSKSSPDKSGNEPEKEKTQRLP